MANEPLDRRAFLRATGGGAMALAVGGCGAGGRAVRGSGRDAEIVRSLRNTVRGPVIASGEPGFAAAAAVYNSRFDARRPLAVVKALDARDAQRAVRWAVDRSVPLTTRSGGHSYAGYSTIANGIVLDLGLLRQVRADPRAQAATVGPGARVFDVYSRLAASGTTVPAGSCPLVGIGGQALGGGIGFASRALGLSSDNLMGAEIVTADGRITLVDDASDPDLLWALRGGGGGNFGVVTALRFQTHATPASAAWFTLGWRWSSAAEALATWFDWASTAPDEITSLLRLTAEAGAPRVEAFGQYLGPSSRLAVLLRPLTTISGARLAGGDQSYLDLQRRWAGCLQLPEPCRDALTPEGVPVGARFWAKSDFIGSGFGATAARTVVEAIQRRASMTGIGAIEFHGLGGAINRVPPRATAFVHRDASCCVQYLTYNTGDDWLRETHDAMRPFVSGAAYQNYIDPELGDWRAAYYGENYPRLVDVRRRVDPHHFFRFPQAIGG